MLGLRRDWLGSERLSWRDLHVIVNHLPDSSALRRGIFGADAEWSLDSQLLAGIVDLLAMANWQRGGDENARKPERLVRPGVAKQVDGQVIAQGKAVSIEEMNAQLGW